jgi:hypothetical protein
LICRQTILAGSRCKVKNYFLDILKTIIYKGNMRLTRKAFQDWGKAGGLLGGPARAKKLSAKRRREIAAMGAAAREAKRANGVEK